MGKETFQQLNFEHRIKESPSVDRRCEKSAWNGLNMHVEYQNKSLHPEQSITEDIQNSFNS